MKKVLYVLCGVSCFISFCLAFELIREFYDEIGSMFVGLFSATNGLDALLNLFGLLLAVVGVGIPTVIFVVSFAIILTKIIKIIREKRFTDKKL